MDEHTNRYHTETLEPALGVTIHIPDRRSRYDITPHARYSDTVTGRRFYFRMNSSQTAVLTVVLCF